MPIHNLAWAKLALASNIMEICRLHGPRALNWVIKWKFCYFCWFLPKIVYQFAIFHLWQLCLSHSSTNNQYHMELKVSRGLKGPNLRLQAKIWQFKLNYAHDCISIFFMLIPCNQTNLDGQLPNWGAQGKKLADMTAIYWYQHTLQNSLF